MVSFEQSVSDQLCAIKNVLNQGNIRESRIFTFTIPESPTIALSTRAFSIGDTTINFRNGTITNPDGTIEKLTNSLESYSRDLGKEIYLRSLTIDTSNDIVLTVRGQPQWKWFFTAGYREITSFIEYQEIVITTNASTAIKLFACTNPQATISNFSKTTVTTLEQDTITGDAIEATTFDAISSLKSNLNRIRNQIISITGEAWGTVSHSIASIWAKFNATTGHKHSGAADDAGQIDHVNLANKGTNTHAQIDTSIGTTLPGLVTTHAALTNPHSSTAAATADRLMLRDSSGRCAVVAPALSTDIALQSTVTSDIATHNAVTNPHSSTALATADRLMLRDGAGRSAVVAPALSTDIALKSTVTDDIATHNAVTNPHSSTAAATADRLMLRDGAGRCAVVAPSASTDIALKSTVTADIATHAALTTTHGTTGVIVGTTDTQVLTNKSFSDQVKLTNTQDVSLSGTTGALIIGGDGTGQHIGIDGNEIESKTSATAIGDLFLNTDGGVVTIGGQPTLVKNSFEFAAVDTIITRAVNQAYQDDGGVFTDYTTAANNATANDVPLMPAVEVVNDAFYIGSTRRFINISINIGTAGVGSAITWEYYNGSAWTAVSGLSDATTGFTVAGTNTVSWTFPTDWAKTTVNSVNTWWIRARVSTASYTVQPLATQIFIVGMVTDVTKCVIGINAAPKTVYLDSAAGAGTIYFIKKITATAGAIDIVALTGNIDAGTATLTNQYDAIIVIFDGGTWYKFGAIP